MKKPFFMALAIAAIAVASHSCNTEKTDGSAAVTDGHGYDVVAYVWDGDEALPRPEHVTGINYAFAVLNDTHDKLVINNEERFRKVIDLKQQKPELKIMLSLGGSGAMGFSEMAADSLKRRSIAGDCARIIHQYGIDGIDVDWEFPGDENGTPEDLPNFALLIKDIRDSIGADRILSVAPGMNMPDVMNMVDYLNIMAYDLGPQAPYHHTPLYRSEHTGWHSVDELIEHCFAQGVPPEKILLGLGFYGRGDGVNFKEWTAYKDIVVTDRQTVEWDSVACVPYVADLDGNLVIGYDSPRSLEIKCDYIKEKGLRGAMYWRTELDADFRPLARKVAESLLPGK